jgi:predicted transport protein
MYWLARLENFGRKERVAVGEFTIEHLMPQNENLSAEWQKALGPDWKQIQEKWLHTLGNLTLTAYNSEFSDRPFLEKRDMPHAPAKGLKQSPLHLNEGLGVIDRWDEQTIHDRANRLAGIAMKVWVFPNLSSEVLNSYRPAVTPQSTYTVEDHPYLLTQEISPLFEAFRSAVLALDPCVTEEFKKLYVAYKAETNFVDVVPLSSRLILSINVRFAELNDPKHLGRDVSNISRWGNGDVEVPLKHLDELPYVLGLVRQALDLQLGGEEN